MKFKILTLTMLGAIMGLTSCNLDSNDEDNFISSEYPTCNLVIPSDGNAFATKASYTLKFYNLDGEVTLATSNLSLGTGTTSFISSRMQLEQVIYSQTQSELRFDGGYFSDKSLKVTDISGFSTSIFNVPAGDTFPGFDYTLRVPFIVSYNVNDSNKVKTFMPDATYTGNTTITTAGTGASFANADVRYRIVFADDLKTASVLFYNAKFAENMPVTINFALKNLPVTYGAGEGYTIELPEGQSIIPEMPEGNDYTPADRYPFTRFLLHTSNARLTDVTIDYTVAAFGQQYLGQFNGSSVIYMDKD